MFNKLFTPIKSSVNCLMNVKQMNFINHYFAIRITVNITEKFASATAIRYY